MTHAHASLDLGRFDHDQRYKFLMASVVPRPIALVTSLGEDGVLNAAPFSSYVVLSIDPPMLGISVAFRDDGACKDTRRNIERSGEFVINSVTADMVAQAHRVDPAVLNAAGRLAGTTYCRVSDTITV